MAAACQAAGLVPVAIDGKSARRAKRATATGCLHLVTAWAAENRLVLGQVTVPDGSNEVAAIPELLRTLDLAGAIVTLDAAGCQVANAQEVLRQGGLYLLAVKGNQPGLAEAVGAVFERACATDFAGMATDGHEATEDAHGRHEERYVTVIYDPPGVAAVVEVNRVRQGSGPRRPTTP
jgi:predicted transposase YbfD/YdcC